MARLSNDTSEERRQQHVVLTQGANGRCLTIECNKVSLKLAVYVMYAIHGIETTPCQRNKALTQAR